MNLTPSRRRFLTQLGLGAAAATLPFHRGLLRAAPDTGIPKRFVGLKYCNGTRPSLWFPADERPDFALTPSLTPLLTPLDAVHEKLIVFRNVSLAASIGPGGSHDAGMWTFLSGAEAPKGGGRTLDQHIAAASPVSQFPSIQLGTRPQISPAISYRAPYEPLRPETSPVAAFDAAFADIAGATNIDALRRLRAERRSVLDVVAADLRELNGALGAEDRRRLEFHAESVRELEQSLAAAVTECALPDAPPVDLDLADDANVPLISKLHMELLTTMLMCRVTHVATHTWGSGAGGYTLPSIGVSLTVHNASHGNIDPNLGRSVHQDVIHWHMTQIGDFLAKLDTILEPDGKSLLHHSAILIGTDNGGGHAIDGIPFVLAGNAGGALRSGRCITYPARTPHNGILLALAEIFGAPVETFGDPKYCSGPLTGLTA
ncbi:MAG: DUF1552 domain-containing protein [Polyangiales bacterium]